jgi:multisubunit Na+/H+ antiporter MnhB subunit
VSISLVVDTALALLIIGLAVWVVAVRTAYAAVTGFVAYGLLLALVWVRLAAVDVALTEAAIGSGLTGLLLLGAAARLRHQEAVEVARMPGPGFRILVGVLCLLAALGLGVVVLLLPEPAPTLAPEITARLPATGLHNPVTGVLMVYRAIDTLFEATVLVPALIAVWSLASDLGWGGRPGSLTPLHSGGPLTLLAQVLPPFGILVGIHLVWVGADAPGGKFQGATVLAVMWLLVLMAGLRRPPVVSGWLLRLLVIVGPAVFLAVGLAGLWWADAFLAFPEGWAKPLILVIEAALTLSVAVTLGLLVAGPPVADSRSKVRS